MKKIIMFALAAASVATMSAQDCKALYEQGKKLEEVFNKEKPTQLAPNKELTPEGAESLLKAYDLYMQAVECEKVPNAKGKVEDKLTKKIDKAIKAHTIDGDFNKAAIVLFNADKRYPEAYNAFMLSGQSTRDLGAVADTVYAVDFYNAGNMAYGTDFEAAAKAYSEARKANTTEPLAYVYNIACLQQLSQKDSTFAAKAADEIRQIVNDGFARFGASNDYIFGNYIQQYLDKNDFEKALSELNTLIEKDPANANLYRLRGIVSNAKRDYKAAVPDFAKAAELTSNFEYARDASKNINNITKFLMGQINNQGTNATPEQKAEIINNFNTALKIAQKAQTLENADGSVADIIDDINYNLENANKL